jgi:hypothetical protein
MVFCDGCPRAYHLQCTDPPLKKVPKGSWLCNNKHDEIYYQSKNWKNADEIISTTTYNPDSELKEEVIIPSLRTVSDYEDTTDPNFSRPNSYIIYQEKTLEQQEQHVEYDLDDDDEHLVERLGNDNLDDNTLEAIIYSLEMESYRRVSVSIRSLTCYLETTS